MLLSSVCVWPNVVIYLFCLVKEGNKQKTNSVALVHKSTILTEQRPLLVGEDCANFFQIEGIAWSVQRIPTAVFSVF
jgi:hypothetical protein